MYSQQDKIGLVKQKNVEYKKYQHSYIFWKTFIQNFWFHIFFYQSCPNNQIKYFLRIKIFCLHFFSGEYQQTDEVIIHR